MACEGSLIDQALTLARSAVPLLLSNTTLCPSILLLELPPYLLN